MLPRYRGFKASTVNVQVGHRGPAAMLSRSREHADDEVTITDLMPLVTLDSSVEKASDDEISVVPPPGTLYITPSPMAAKTKLRIKKNSLT